MLRCKYMLWWFWLYLLVGHGVRFCTYSRCFGLYKIKSGHVYHARFLYSFLCISLRSCSYIHFNIWAVCRCIKLPLCLKQSFSSFCFQSTPAGRTLKIWAVYQCTTCTCDRASRHSVFARLPPLPQHASSPNLSTVKMLNIKLTLNTTYIPAPSLDPNHT